MMFLISKILLPVKQQQAFVPCSTIATMYIYRCGRSRAQQSTKKNFIPVHGKTVESSYIIGVPDDIRLRIHG